MIYDVAVELRFVAIFTFVIGNCYLCLDMFIRLVLRNVFYEYELLP